MSFTNLRDGFSGHRTRRRHDLTRFKGLSDPFLPPLIIRPRPKAKKRFYLACDIEVSKHE